MADATGIANERLQSLIARIERLEAEKAELANDIKEIYQEAKSAGFDAKIMRQVVRLRKIDAKQRDEEEQLREVYLGALEGTPLGDAAKPRHGKPVSQETAEELAAELAKVPFVTGVKVIRTTTVEPHDPETDDAPPKSVAGSVAALRTAMNAPQR